MPKLKSEWDNGDAMKKNRLKEALLLLKTTYKNWKDRDPFRQSAVIAYNAIFSLPGLLIVVVTIAGYFFGAESVTGRLHSQITLVMGKNTADEIQQMVTLANKSQNTLVATIVGFITIILGATGVLVEFQSSLNKIWEVKADPDRSGIWIFIKTRLFSFGLIVSIGFLLLVSLVLSSLLAGVSSWVQQHWSQSLLIVFKIIDFIISLGMITLLFALMFKILPDAKVKWRCVWIGAFVTSLLFVVGKTGLGLYFGKTDPASGYGAAGSVVLILLWASYSSIIVIFGAEFTKVYSDRYFGETLPAKTAVKEKSEAK